MSDRTIVEETPASEREGAPAEPRETKRAARSSRPGKTRPSKAASPTPSAKTAKRKSAASPVPWERIQAEARKRFGVKGFRPGQREVLEAVFTGRDVIALMPTGAGKSLCYQLPALFLPKPVVVVSPLIALMQDQREKAEEADIAVEKMDSTQTATERTESEEAIEEGSSQLVYVTPERLENKDFLETLKQSGVSLLAVDEAHCISQWGHDFRPAYMGLGYAREQLGNPPVAALTATATEDVVREIEEQLRLRDPLIVNTGTERPNLTFSVHHTVNTEAKLRQIGKLVEDEEGTGVVYTASVKSATALFEWLKEHGIAVGRYHGKMRPREREDVQARFMAGEYKVLIATKAFGMGVDKPDIRFVYHYEFPDSVESYYQEAGRAGRDGLPAKAVLLYRLEDKRIQRFFLVGRYPRIEELRRVLGALPNGPGEPGQAAAIAERTKTDGDATAVGLRRTQAILYILKSAGLVERTAQGFRRRREEVADAELEELIASFRAQGEEDRNRLGEMMRYAESPACRKQFLRSYFGEERGEPCGECDSCLEEQVNPGLSASRDAGRDESLPQSERSEVEQAVEVEMAIGTVTTTAPETLPQREEAPFHAGDSVRHARFGPGRVVELDGENLLVRFEAGMKRVRPTYLRAS